MKAYCVPLLATLVSGCATFQPPKEVLIPVSTTCLIEFSKPYFATSEELKALPCTDDDCGAFIGGLYAEYVKQKNYIERT